MVRIFILLILFAITCSKKNTNKDPVAETKNNLKKINEVNHVHNRHKPIGSDLWPGNVNTKNSDIFY